MNDKTEPKRNYVIVESREQKFVTCPHCWTDQRTERNFCYCCGARFIYHDEQGKENISGQAPEEEGITSEK
jgi:predicted amidophosphoribosyltransferase